MNKPMATQRTARTRAVTQKTDPFFGFRQEMDTLFDRFFGNSRLMSWPRSTLVDWNVPTGEDVQWMYPEIDVVEDEKEFFVTAELPGMAEDDFEVTVANGVLTLKGDKRMEKIKGNGRKERLIERRFGRFERSFTLPPTVDPEHIDATFKQGVLWIKLPKVKAAVPKEKRILIH